MNDCAVNLFKQASEEAYKLCKEHDRKVGEVDHIWVSIMAANLADLIVQECANFVDTAISNGGVDGCMLKEHFGVK